MSTLKTTLAGYAKYQGREGQLGFLLHRITGLGTLLFLAIHILDSSLVYFNPKLYMDAILIYQSTLFGIGEIFLVFCVLFHGVNGLRIAFVDLVAPKFWALTSARQAIRWTLAISVVLWVPAAAIMIRNLLINNFHLFGA
jgi:succinate dehydrogenase / fumarate reductase cytochrome b subunit